MRSTITVVLLLLAPLFAACGDAGSGALGVSVAELAVEGVAVPAAPPEAGPPTAAVVDPGAVQNLTTEVPVTATPLPTPVVETGEPYPHGSYPGPGAKPGEKPIYGYRVVNTYPHDPRAFTQGLVYDNGLLLEGTGRYGQSDLREVVLETGEILRQQPLDNSYFGEGIVLFGGRIIQLTWQSSTGFVYDRETFERLATFSYPTQGWGITHDGEKLIMSDGSSMLYFWDPETLAEIGRIAVTAGGEPVTQLNELEYINGEIFANIWQTDRIARISPETGEVLGWIDLTGLLDDGQAAGADVLNGIAYDAAGDRLFVTGKYWPLLFEIELVPSATATDQ